MHIRGMDQEIHVLPLRPAMVTKLLLPSLKVTFNGMLRMIPAFVSRWRNLWGSPPLTEKVAHLFKTNRFPLTPRLLPTIIGVSTVSTCRKLPELTKTVWVVVVYRDPLGLTGSSDVADGQSCVSLDWSQLTNFRKMVKGWSENTSYCLWQSCFRNTLAISPYKLVPSCIATICFRKNWDLHKRWQKRTQSIAHLQLRRLSLRGKQQHQFWCRWSTGHAIRPWIHQYRRSHYRVAKCTYTKTISKRDTITYEILDLLSQRSPEVDHWSPHQM